MNLFEPHSPRTRCKVSVAITHWQQRMAHLNTNQRILQFTNHGVKTQKTTLSLRCSSLSLQVSKQNDFPQCSQCVSVSRAVPLSHYTPCPVLDAVPVTSKYQGNGARSFQKIRDKWEWTMPPSLHEQWAHYRGATEDHNYSSGCSFLPLLGAI